MNKVLFYITEYVELKNCMGFKIYGCRKSIY